MFPGALSRKAYVSLVSYFSRYTYGENSCSPHAMQSFLGDVVFYKERQTPHFTI